MRSPLAERPISTVPGWRTPHLWLRRQSPYDVLGLDFTLLRFDPDVDVSALAAAATQRGVPMAVVDLESDDAATLYPHKLLLSRPDLPWLGGDPIALIDRVRGAAAGGVRV